MSMDAYDFSKKSSSNYFYACDYTRFVLYKCEKTCAWVRDSTALLEGDVGTGYGVGGGGGGRTCNVVK